MILILLVTLAACNNGGDSDGGKTSTDSLTQSVTDSGTTASVADNFTIISSDGTTDYQLVRSEKASSAMISQISDFYRLFVSKYGVKTTSFKLTTDWYKEGDTIPAHEILVGTTNRAETQSILSQLKEKDYAIALVGEKLVICGGSDESTIQAVNYFIEHYMTESSLSLPKDLSYLCQSPPEVISYSPENYYYYEDVYTPVLNVSYICSPALDRNASKLVISGTDYTSSAVWSDSGVTLSGVTFPAGDYEAVLTICDTNGNTYQHVQNFSCGDGSVMHLYRGEVHSHSSESDGAGSVSDAYTYARDVAKLDFFAVTDHSSSITKDILQYTHARIAEQFNDPGTFVALYGFEQTYNISTGYYGHLNVLNTLKFTTQSSANLTAFYKIMAKETNAIVQFNHPGYSWGDFLDYDKYSEDIDKILTLTEIKGSGYDITYALSLTKGWHVSPMYNEDNHEANWGNAYEACGYALAPALTRENILEAFRKNRTYTTTDGSMKIYFKINGEWMGSRLDNPDSLDVSVEISTERPVGLGTISIVTEDNIVVASVNVGPKKSYIWNITLSPDYDYYYVEVSNSSYWAATAPVWIENRNLINITSVEQSLLVNNSDDNDYGVKAAVTNSAKSAMTDVTVSFYKSPLGGFNITSSPFATVNLGTVQAGATVYAEAFTSYSLSSNRITVTVTGKIDGKSYSDTSYTMVSPLYMTEVLPSMSAYNGVAIPFCYMELYNNSDTVLDLSSYSIRYYPKAGASADDLKANTWTLSGTIQPHSTLVVWFKTSTKLTAADFNAKFGTSLVEGKDLLIISASKTLAVSKAVQLELMSGSTVVDRIWYNWGDNPSEVKSDKAITFDYNHTYTQTSVQTSNSASPTPGTVTSSQVPSAVTK
jgi:hypothetical protein